MSSHPKGHKNKDASCDPSPYPLPQGEGNLLYFLSLWERIEVRVSIISIPSSVPNSGYLSAIRSCPYQLQQGRAENASLTSKLNVITL